MERNFCHNFPETYLIYFGGGCGVGCFLIRLRRRRIQKGKALREKNTGYVFHITIKIIYIDYSSIFISKKMPLLFF